MGQAWMDIREWERSDSSRRVRKGCSHKNQPPIKINTLHPIRDPQPMRQNAKEEA